MTILQLVLDIPAVSAPLCWKKSVELARICGEVNIARVTASLFLARETGEAVDLASLARFGIFDSKEPRSSPGVGPPVLCDEFRDPSCVRDWRRRVIEDSTRILARDARKDFRGIYWENRKRDEELLSASLATGTAGIVLALLVFSRYHLTLGSLSDDSTHQAAHWLAAQPSTSRSGGLFTGHAGIGMILAVAAKHFGDRKIMEQSYRFFRSCGQGSILDPDFYFGGAGMLFAGVCIAEITADEGVLEEVIPVVKFLKDTVKERSGLVYWESSEVLGPPRAPNLSLAHGAAGAALALGVYGRRYGDRWAQDIATAALHGIFDRGKNSFDSQIRTAMDDDRHTGPAHFWCRGLGGLLWAYLQYFSPKENVNCPKVEWMAERLLASPAAGNASICHGLGGRIELLRMLSSIDRYKARCEEGLLSCRHSLSNCSVCVDGFVTWPTEESNIFSNELWLGGLSAASSLALVDSGHLSPLVSIPSLKALSVPRAEATDAA